MPHNKRFIHINTAFVQGGKPPCGEGLLLVLILLYNDINIMLLSFVLLLLLLEVALEEQHD